MCVKRWRAASRPRTMRWIKWIDSARRAADKLELQLRRDPDGGRTADVRSEDPLTVPAGYQAAVADYFRRLSKNP